MAVSIEIRTVRSTDSPAIVDLVTRCFAPFPGCVMAVEAEESGLLAPAVSFDHFFVATRSGHVVGTIAGTQRADGMAELKKLYVDPDIRRAGLGRRLVTTLEAALLRGGNRSIELWSDTRFTAAHRLYERLGFQRSDRTHRALHDRSGTVEHHWVRWLEPHERTATQS